jgi:hypothetical protein
MKLGVVSGFLAVAVVDAGTPDGEFVVALQAEEESGEDFHDGRGWGRMVKMS